MKTKRIFSDDFYRKIKEMEYEELEELLSELESRLLRLNLFYKSCEAKVERIDPFSEEFEILAEKILETKSDIEIVSKKACITRITAVQKKRNVLLKTGRSENE